MMTSGHCRVWILLLALVLTLAQGFAAFAESPDCFAYTVLEDGSVRITGYDGAETDPVIPESIDGHPVTGLGKSFSVSTAAARNIRSLTLPDTMTDIEPGALQFAVYLEEIRFTGEHQVFLFQDGVLYNREKQSLLAYLRSNTTDHFAVPDGIREIEDRAFFRNSLLSVSIPGSVERIGRECFDQSVRLTEVLLAEGLKTIGRDAFANCDKIRGIEIPASVTDIEESAFTDNHMSEIRVADGSTVMAVSGGALINIRDGVLLAYPEYSEAETCVIPEGVTRIGRFAFYRSHRLKRVVFPDGLLEIGEKAFFSCNHLTELILPDSVVRLEDSAFGENSDVETLHLPAGLTEIANNFTDMRITELEIPDTVISIGGSFSALPGLKEVVIPGSVGSIGERSFTFCENLAAVTIPAGVTDIRTGFAGCAGTLVIRVEPGSYAEQYCRDYPLDYERIQD